MTNSGTNQEQAATAVRQAAIDMGYSCVEIDAITARFEAQGYNLPAYTCVLSVDEFAASNISIYPNPAIDHFTIEGIQENDILEIRDLQGRLIQSENVNSAMHRVYLDNQINPGMYLVRIYSGSKEFTQRLLIQ